LLERQNGYGKWLFGHEVDETARLRAAIEQGGRSLHDLRVVDVGEIARGVVMHVR